MSAPPEVVFNTATDPSRFAGWLPEPLRDSARCAPSTAPELLRARWEVGAQPAWSAELWVEPTGAGGSIVCLCLTAQEPDQRLTEIADASLTGLARQVADNLTAG